MGLNKEISEAYNSAIDEIADWRKPTQKLTRASDAETAKRQKGIKGSGGLQKSKGLKPSDGIRPTGGLTLFKNAKQGVTDAETVFGGERKGFDQNNPKFTITRSGTSDFVTVTDGNVHINLQPFPRSSGGGGGGVTQQTFPLQPVKTDDNKIRFRYGTVHGIVPEIGGTEITSNLNDASNPEITISGDVAIYVKVNLATSTYEAESPVIESAASVPSDVDRVSAHHLLVNVTYASSSAALGQPVHQGSIDMASCAGVLNYWDLG